MARLSLVLLAFAFGASTSSASALSHSVGHQSGHDKLARAHVSGNITDRAYAMQKDWKLKKRFSGARCTNYAAGLGACGATNSDSDWIVALNQEQYGNGEHCFDTITITYQGKSAQAQIVDKCMECPYAGIDLTPSLFQHFASLDQGVFYADWSFGSGDTPTTTSTPPPQTTTKQKTTSSTWTPETTSSSSTSTWSSSSASSTTSASSSSTSSVASATPSVDTSSALEVLDYGVIQLGGLISGAAQVNLETSESS